MSNFSARSCCIVHFSSGAVSRLKIRSKTWTSPPAVLSGLHSGLISLRRPIWTTEPGFAAAAAAGAVVGFAAGAVVGAAAAGAAAVGLAGAAACVGAAVGAVGPHATARERAVPPAATARPRMNARREYVCADIRSSPARVADWLELFQCALAAQWRGVIVYVAMAPG